MSAITAKRVSIDVLANDAADATLVSVTKPAHGRTIMVQGRVLYISDEGFDGEDSFEYWITLPDGGKLKGRVVLQVKGNSVSRDLALTGANSMGLSGSAVALLALGLLLVLLSRRRSEDDGTETVARQS